MGMDVYSGSGVIATTEQMIDLLKNPDKEMQASIVFDLLQEVAATDFEEDEDTFKPLIDLADKLAEEEENPDFGVPAFSEFEKALKACIVISEIYGEKELEGSFMMSQLWNCFLETARPDLPWLEEALVFDKGGRLEGFDIPQGVVCFIFASSDCFDTKLSKKGKALKEAIGHCEESEWTRVSY